MSQRHLDVTVAVAAFLLLAPLMLLIVLAIRFDDGGPVLFVQQRVGEGKRHFRIVKFRTMRDERVTRVGRWLRQTGLDELPQLFNMLRGDMSLIGPRPLTDADVRRLGWDGAAHAARWSVRPGVIGLAQLYAGRGKRQSWFLDARYVRARCGLLDLGIVAATAAVGIVGKRRVRRWLRDRRRLAAVRVRRRDVVRPPKTDVRPRRALAMKPQLSGNGANS